MHVKDLHYVFKCLKCPTMVTGTLPELEVHGWVDVSTLEHQNQWLCPACARGLQPVTPETSPGSL